MKDKLKAGRAKAVPAQATSPGRKESAMYTDSALPGWNWLYVNSKLVTGVSPLGMYLHLTGVYDTRTVQSKENLTPAQKVVNDNLAVGELLRCLYGLFQVSGYQHLLNEYQAGNVSPALKEILDYQPEIDFRAMETETGFGREYKAEVWAAAKEGKIDFSSIQANGDSAPDWFLKYNIRPNAIPGLFGSVRSMLAVGPLESPSLEIFHKDLKKEMKRQVTSLLQDGLPAEALFTLAGEIKERYEALDPEKVYHFKHTFYTYPYSVSPFPYYSEYEAGFAVDLHSGVIHDLRPHTKELRELLKPSYEPLKEFYYALRRYAQDISKKEEAISERTPKALFENTPFLMMRNSRESNAIASVSGSMMQIAVQQELPLGTDEPLYNYSAKIPMKKGEVIVAVKETPKGGVLRPSTEKLHILFDTLFTKTKYNEFIFPVDAYMELCKRKPDDISPDNRRKFRQKLRQDLQRMKKTTFSASLPGCKPGEIGILDAWLPAPNNCIYIKLETLYCDSLRQRDSGTMQIPITIFKTNEQNPHLIPIMRALCRNRTDNNNVNMEIITGNQRAHTISLKTLYEWDLALPRWEKVSKTRQFRRNIIDPLFSAIKELNEEKYIISKYINPDGEEYSQEDMRTASIVDILDPKRWLLSYEIVGYQDDPVKIQAAMQRRKEREEQATLAHAKRLVAADRKRRKAIEEINKN